MLKELRKKEWLDMLGLSEASIPSALILRGTRNLQHHYRRYAAHFSNVIELGSPKGFLEDVFVGRKDGGLVAYASVYGGSMASEVVHIFGELGTRYVIQTGCCGGLDDDLKLGDLVVGTQAFSGEGVAQYYSGKTEFEGETIPWNSSVYHGRPRPRPLRLYTTAALLAEGYDEVAEWKRRGFNAVDMETAAVFAVAEAYGMRRCSLLFVSDLPHTPTGLLHTPLDAHAILDQADDKLVEVAIEAATQIGRPS